MTKLRHKSTREVTPTYWRQLIEAGIPIDAANAIAWAIARYDAARRIPNAYQKALINRYCPLVCRAGLWRSQLLLDA
ncbi:hypothetical protein ACQ4M4_00605 [Leptolyngbya sp. AN02str]|uniref:hypothetical protein n=1 Tax=Leptolyngbya sp. AN02str TaxID=3423363 RepID=UPI003D30F89D